MGNTMKKEFLRYLKLNRLYYIAEQTQINRKKLLNDEWYIKYKPHSLTSLYWQTTR